MKTIGISWTHADNGKHIGWTNTQTCTHKHTSVSDSAGVWATGPLLFTGWLGCSAKNEPPIPQQPFTCRVQDTEISRQRDKNGFLYSFRSPPSVLLSVYRPTFSVCQPVCLESRCQSCQGSVPEETKVYRSVNISKTALKDHVQLDLSHTLTSWHKSGSKEDEVQIKDMSVYFNSNVSIMHFLAHMHSQLHNVYARTHSTATYKKTVKDERLTSKASIRHSGKCILNLCAIKAVILHWSMTASANVHRRPLLLYNLRLSCLQTPPERAVEYWWRKRGQGLGN